MPPWLGRKEDKLWVCTRDKASVTIFSRPETWRMSVEDREIKSIFCRTVVARGAAKCVSWWLVVGGNHKLPAVQNVEKMSHCQVDRR